MIYPLIILLNAEIDIEDGYSWYESQQVGLGARFLRRLEEALERLRANPYLNAARRKRIRIATIKRFPFLIVYRMESRRVVVVYALIHTKRGPEFWKHKLS